MRFIAFFLLTISLFSLSSCNPLAPAQERQWPNTKWYFYTPGDTVDNFWPVAYQPKQPIPFSHKLHAGDMKMPCEYCHSAARHGPSAGIPPMNTCMGCHKVAAVDKEPIKYLTEKYNKQEAMDWIKVHDSPDFARFSHKPHVAKAGLACQECHGPVQEMDEVYQHAPLQMGWCLRCHVDKNAPIKCFTCHY